MKGAPAGKPQYNLLPKQVEVPCGSLKRNSLPAIAYNAARKLTRQCSGQAMSLTLDLDGLAFLEPPASACAYDIVGTYEGTRPMILERAMLEDLKHFLELRDKS